MVNLDDLLINGSIIVSMDKEGKLIGSALLRMSNGFVPIEIAGEALELVNSYEKIINKLKNGNKLYCANGKMYIGYHEYRGPYADEEVFVSFSDVNNTSFDEMLCELDNKLSKSNVRRIELVRDGAFYEKISNKK